MSEAREPRIISTPGVRGGRPRLQGTGLTVKDVLGALAAGDTIVVLLSAYNAGFIGVVVLTGALTREQLEPHPHDHILDSVADIPNLPAATP